MIQHICRPLGEHRIPSRLGIRAQSKHDFAQVVHIHILIDDHKVFGEHHLPHPPETMHDLVGLHGIGLADTDTYQIVEDAFGWQSNIHNFWKIHAKHRQEELDTRLAHVEVLHRRNAHNGCRINGILAMRDRSDVEHGIGLRQGVITRMIPKRPFHAQRFGGIDISFDHDVRIGWHLQ